MRRRSLSARLGRHMERGEELMELNRVASGRCEEVFRRNEEAFRRNEEAFRRNEVAFERNTQAFERLMAAFDRHEQKFEEITAQSRDEKDDLKVFIREINLRAERRTEEWARRSDELSAEQRARTDAIVRRLDDLTAESKAQREALLALIDRLPPGPGGLRAVD